MAVSSPRGAPLAPGHRVAAVAPAGPSPTDTVDAGLARWTARGRAVVRYLDGCTDGYLAADDATRAACLRAALDDPTVGALHATRGGYGTTRLLERWGEGLAAAVARRAIPLVGFSDLTALHAAWTRAGVRSVHGVMLSAAGRAAPDTWHSDDDFCALAAVLEGAPPPAWTGLVRVDDGGRAGPLEGRAVGGNLTVLGALAGTGWMPTVDGAVWLLEDVGEAPYRLDRTLTQLRMAGAFRGARAVVLGAFTDCAPRGDATTAEAALRRGLEGLGVPVWSGAPFGHGGVHRPWVQGARVRVTDDGAVEFLEGLG